MRMPVWVILLAAFALHAAGTNFSGKWALQSAAGRGGPSILALNHVGNEATGTLTPRFDQSSGSPTVQEIFDGKVEGDTLTFYVWVGGDEPVKQLYKGTMSGDEIAFTVTSGGRGAAAQQMTAKRTR